MIGNAIAFVGELVMNTTSATVERIGNADRHVMVRGGDLAFANGKITSRIPNLSGKSSVRAFDSSFDLIINHLTPVKTKD